MTQKRELLREHLFQSAVGREQAVTHEDGLLAVPDHVPVEAPIIVSFLLLLSDNGRGMNEHESKEQSNETHHGIPPSNAVIIESVRGRVKRDSRLDSTPSSLRAPLSELDKKDSRPAGSIEGRVDYRNNQHGRSLFAFGPTRIEYSCGPLLGLALFSSLLTKMKWSERKGHAGLGTVVR